MREVTSPLEGADEFETHLTVHLEDVSVVDALQQWGAERGLRCVHILLDRGRHVSQPMLTRRASGTLDAQLRAAEALTEELAAAGYTVTRIKVEAAPENAGVPRSAAEAEREPEGRYFEHHVKLLLPPGGDEAPLLEVAAQHGAHLSRNDRRRREDGAAERFVTQRCWGAGRTEARGRLNALLAELAPLGHPVLAVEQEYVVFDSNAAIDSGWLREDA